MAKKNLPIKLFQKRKIDERRTEGGGDSKPPKWILKDKELEERAQFLLESFDEITEKFASRSSHGDFIPIAIKVDISENAIAKSHRKDIRRLFYGKNSKNNVIGFIDSNTLLVKLDSLDESGQVQANIRNFNRYAKSVSAVESIQIFKPFIVRLNSKDALKVSLIDFLNSELNNSVKISFKKFCHELNLNVKEIFYSSELIVFKIKEISKSTLDKLSDFEALESVTYMPKYQIGLDILESNFKLKAKKPNPQSEYPIVGIL